MVLKIGKPNEKQELALLDHHRHIGYGGARGGGKSWFVRAKAVSLAYYYPGIKIKIIRRTFPELQENHIEPLCEMLKVGTPEAAASYNDGKKLMIFPNGSKIRFGYCNNDNDVRIYQGMESDIVFIDEATQFPEDWTKAIAASVRGVNDFPKRIYYTCNPGGVGHAYIKRIFIDKVYMPYEHPEDYSFIQALVYDNKALMESDPNYLRMLESQPEARRKAWMDGSWDSFEGQVFEEFRNLPEHYEDRIGTHVIDPFVIPGHWKIYRGLDWGYTKPFAVHWYAVDEDRRMYCIKEYYGCTREANTGVRLDPKEVAKTILEIEKTEPLLKDKHIIGIADPAIWGTQTGQSIAEMMEEMGVYHDKGDHNRLSGKMQCHYRLKFDDRGVPMFYTFSTCRHFIRTIPTLIYDETHVEDIDTDGEDHIYDEWRYVCMENPITIKPTVTKHKPDYDPLDLWEG